MFDRGPRWSPRTTCSYAPRISPRDARTSRPPHREPLKHPVPMSYVSRYWVIPAHQCQGPYKPQGTHPLRALCPTPRRASHRVQAVSSGLGEFGRPLHVGRRAGIALSKLTRTVLTSCGYKFIRRSHRCPSINHVSANVLDAYVYAMTFSLPLRLLVMRPYASRTSSIPLSFAFEKPVLFAISAWVIGPRFLIMS